MRRSTQATREANVGADSGGIPETEIDVEIGEVLLRHRQPYLGGVGGEDDGQRSAGRDELADIDLLLPDTAGERCPDDGSLESQTRLLEVRLSRLQRGPGFGHLWLAQGQGGRLAGAERLPLLLGDRGLGLLDIDPNARLGDLGVGLGDGQFIVARIDLHQKFVALEEAAVGEAVGDAFHAAGDLSDER